MQRVLLKARIEHASDVTAVGGVPADTFERGREERTQDHSVLMDVCSPSSCRT